MQLPNTKYVLLSVPRPHVLLVTINLAKQMNSLPVDACWEMDSVWRFLDKEPELRVGVITGAGDKAFSSGMDLKERASQPPPTSPTHQPHRTTHYPPTGFGGLTRRHGNKPILAAVNGHAHGGGFELALNADIVLASPNATFCLPDVKRGTAALQGAFPRLVRTLGMQRASVLGLTGYVLRAREAKEWGLVARICEERGVVEETLEMAGLIAGMSPDSVVVTRAGLREAWETASVERAVQITEDRWGEWLMGGGNVKEGMRAFAEKREPVWKPSKL